MVPIKNRVGKNRTLKQNKVREATNLPLSPATNNIRNCINKQIMYIKSDQERMIILSWSDTSQRIGKMKNFPKRRGRGLGRVANDLKWGG